jgi:hypothetical protein
VHATSSDALEAIPALIKKLDVPAEEEHRVKARVFKPQRIVLDDRVAQQLRVAVSLQGRMAVDENGNLVVVQDTDESLAAFAALLSRLDEGAAENPPPAVLRLRVVWLVSGMERKETTALPSDLKGVVSDLAKIGVEGLQIAAQTMVNTAVIDCFQVQCSPDLDNPCDLTISGSFSVPKGKMPSLQIQIRGEERVAIVGRDGNRSQSSRTLCHLNTTIQAPRGHFVVLGAVPVGKMNSVFVVQVTGE